MSRKKPIIHFIYNLLFFLTGFSIGIISIWPGILKVQNRNCFIKIIKDGSDGKVSFGTVLSIDPKYIIKIKNAKNSYFKILLIGDQCFRK